MYKIAAMGDSNSISGFAALGISVFPTEDQKDAAVLLGKLASGNFAVILITEALAAVLEDEIAQDREKTVPAIILIPGISGNTGRGMSGVIDSVEKAVGSNILSNE